MIQSPVISVSLTDKLITVLLKKNLSAVLRQASAKGGSIELFEPLPGIHSCTNSFSLVVIMYTYLYGLLFHFVQSLNLFKAH